jgi:hypothetical protein
MKAFIILAVTGGLFLTSGNMDSKPAKNNKVCVKSAKHCIKKCCNNVKKAKGNFAKTVVVNS